MRSFRALPLIAVLAFAPPLHADLFTPSKADQIKLGQRAAADLRRQEKVLPGSDPKVQLVRRVASRLLSTVSGKGEPWAYSFDVIQSKQLNAFALPGGPTFIYSGLLDKITTEDELAGVMAHELTHVRKQHWAHMYASSQKRQLGLTAILLIFRANSNVANLASISNDLIFNLPFSRKAESEADAGGFQMMTSAGYNPEGLADVFRLLENEAKGGKPPEFLSDHPADKSRISRIEQMIQSSGRSYPPQRPLRFN